MDNPGISLFQQPNINLMNNSQNDEEEEDLEDQKRRNEEIQNLLMEKLDDFNFDDSTINSSTNVSVVSVDDAQKKYRNAIEPNEQLKVLYEVRTRELSNLQSEYNEYKTGKSKEVDSLKQKLFLYEAEIQQLQVSFKNSQELLVEKESEIQDQKKELTYKEDKIKKYEKAIADFQENINTYQIAISELQLKLQAGPLYNKKPFNSEELQKAHQEQIIKLENLLEQQTKSAQLLEKEKTVLEEEMEKLISIEKEDQNIIQMLTQNFDSAQKHCEELIKVIEDISIENNHLKERLNTKQEQDFITTPIDDAAEKLKKMLVDKSMEINVLKSKTKDYEENAKELLEYRKLKTDVYKREFQQCDNKEHTKSLLLMQNDLQNYRRIIDDKNQQILILNTNNKDLLGKMEDMLSQTRNDIQNFSHKYNLPQLEKMAEDLKKAEERIRDLESQLEKSQEKCQILTQKLQKVSKSPDKDIRKEFETLLNNVKLQYEKEKNNFENQLKQLKKELEISSKTDTNMKQYIDQLINENTKLKMDLQNTRKIASDDEPELKRQYLETAQDLSEARNKLKAFEKKLEDMNNVRQTAEDEKNIYQSQLKDCQAQMETLAQALTTLESEVSQLSKKLEEKDGLINKLIKNSTENEMLHKDILYKNNALQVLEENKKELVELLEKTNNELEESKKQVLELQQQLLESKERNVRRNLEIELKEAEIVMQESRREEDIEAVELLKTELKIREEVQKEYLEKLKEIEGNYEKACVSGKELYKELADKLKIQENRYREQLALVLKECAQKIKSLEDHRNALVERINVLQLNFEQYKAKVTVSEEAYMKVVKNAQISAKKNADDWKRWSKKFVSSCLKIETINKNFRDNLNFKMNYYDKEISAIEKSHDDKIRKYVKNCR